MEHRENAKQHLEKAKKSLALAEEPEAHATVSNLKRNLEVEEEL